MCEINEKDLEKATGGIQFFKPGEDRASEYGAILMKVDLNHCCEHFERAMCSTGSDIGCVNCSNIRKDSTGDYYCWGYRCDRNTGEFCWEG